MTLVKFRIAKTFGLRLDWPVSSKNKRADWSLLINRVLEVDKVPTGSCPECEADVHVDTDVDKGEIVECEECGIQLEIVGLDPVELDIVEEEDGDDDEDEDEY